MAKIILLIISLALVFIGLLIAWLQYRKDKSTGDTKAVSKIGKRIFFLILIMGLLNTVVPVINSFKPEKPTASKTDLGEAEKWI